MIVGRHILRLSCTLPEHKIYGEKAVEKFYSKTKNVHYQLTSRHVRHFEMFLLFPGTSSSLGSCTDLKCNWMQLKLNNNFKIQLAVSPKSLPFKFKLARQFKQLIVVLSLLNEECLKTHSFIHER